MQTYKVVIQAGKAPVLKADGKHEYYPVETHSFDVDANTVGEAVAAAEVRVAVGHNHVPVHVTKVLDKAGNNLLGHG